MADEQGTTSEEDGQATSRGYLMLLVGDERGTSDAALGIALRGAGHNLRVHIIEFLKTGRERGEVAAVSLLTGVTLSQYGLISVDQTGEELKGPGISPERLDAALNEAATHVRNRVTNLLIMDGLLTAVDEGLVEEAKILDLVDKAASWLDIVVTGRDAPDSLKAAADTVTEMRTVKSDESATNRLRRGIHY